MEVPGDAFADDVVDIGHSMDVEDGDGPEHSEGVA